MGTSYFVNCVFPVCLNNGNYVEKRIHANKQTHIHTHTQQRASKDESERAGKRSDIKTQMEPEVRMRSNKLF